MTSRRIGLAVWLLMTVMLWFFENNTGTWILLAAAILVPLVTILCARYAAGHMMLSLSCPDSMTAGERYDITLLADRAWPQWGCSVRGQLYVKNRLTGESESIPMRVGETVPVAFTHCGQYVLRIQNAYAWDWFGVTRSPVRVSQKACVARPVHHPVMIDMSPAARSVQQQGRQSHLGSMEPDVVGVRDYVPGDPLRRMHWKLTEKLDRPLVKEQADPEQTQILLVLDNHATVMPDPQAIHETVRALWSVVRQLRVNHMTFTAAVYDPTEGAVLTEVADDQSAEHLLDTVLRQPFTEGESVARLVAERYPEALGGSTVVFTPDGDTDAVSLCRGGRVTLILPQQRAESSAAPWLAVCGLSEDHNVLAL